jgi:hypothetical protein
MTKKNQKTDYAVDQLAAALANYEESHPGSECFVRRYNPASIRVKIVDPVFHGWNKGKRHDYAVRYLRCLPEDVLSQISILLCLEPGETSLLDMEFQDPSRSRL